MPSVKKDDLKKLVKKETGFKKDLADLRLTYSDADAMLRNLRKIQDQARIYPRFLPTQASGRWSTIDPPLTNFPKRCINPFCPEGRHRKSEECWSMRDCIQPDRGEFWIEWDLDAVEARIYALILEWKERLDEFTLNLDIHTPVCCSLFDLPLPFNLANPHTNPVDADWREKVKWEGKDDKRRTMGKNFTYGGQYFYVSYDKKSYKLKYSPEYVFLIPGIEEYGLDRKELIKLAHKFVESSYEIQLKKAMLMEKIRKEKIARSLYGFRRVFFQSNQNTAKEGFNHIIQATVARYMDDTAILLQEEFPDSHLIHQAHDSLKWAFPIELDIPEVHEKVKNLAQRDIFSNGLSVKITATFHTIYSRG